MVVSAMNGYENSNNAPIYNKPELSHTLLAEITNDPAHAVQIILGENGHHRESRIHALFVIIEQNMYEENENAFLSLDWNKFQKARIHDHILDIKKKFKEFYPEQANKLMQQLIEHIFPEQKTAIYSEQNKAEIVKTLDA